jgi:hypothetical protein
MDWASLATDAGVLAAISAAIFVAIDFIKKLYYRLPYKWVQNTPGEIWFALSMILGITAAIILNWNDFQTIFAGNASWVDKGGEVITGLIFGTGSKAVHAIASPAGAKLQSFKLEHKAKSDALTQGTGYIAPGTGVEALQNVSTPTIVEQECATPVPLPLIEETTPTPVEERPPKPEIIFVKSTTGEDYLLVNGKKYEISMQVLELTKED